MDQKKVFIPSQQIIEGEILVKGKTLGRWQPKRFLLDEEQQVFALKSSDPKKKYRTYYLPAYKITNYERKKERYQFELTPNDSAGKKVLMGSENEKQIRDIVTKLNSLMNKRPITQSRGSIGPLHLYPSSNVRPIEKLDCNLPSFFEIDDITDCIGRTLKSDFQPGNYDLIHDGELKLFQHKENLHQFRVHLELQNTTQAKVFGLLENIDAQKLWNQYIAPESEKFKDLEDKSFAISEVRKLAGYFCFPREFIYIAYAFRMADIQFLLMRNYDMKGKQLKKGVVKYAVWSIIQQPNAIQVYLETEQSMMGLQHADEDASLIKQYLLEITKIKKILTGSQRDSTAESNLVLPTNGQQQKKQESKIQISEAAQPPPQLQQSSQAAEAQQVPKAEAPPLQQQVQPAPPPKEVQEPLQSQENIPQPLVVEDDEFFDCEDEDKLDAMNDKLFISESLNQEKNQVQDQCVQEITTSQRVSIYHSTEKDSTLQDWVEKRIKAFLSGAYTQLATTALHRLQPQEVDFASRIFIREDEGGHYILKKDFVRDEKNGGLKCINEEKLAAQKTVIKFLLTKIGTSLLMGKSLTSISMPVTIFEPRSNTERVCNSMGFAPVFLEDGARSGDKYERVKSVTKFSLGFIFTYLSMEKPFNPILGETYQGFIDGCPIYCEQISHHPPVCVTQLYGRGYRIDARLELVANFHSNSVVGRNVGEVKVIFENPAQEVRVLMAPGGLNGTTFGDKVLNYLERHLVLDLQNRIFVELVFNPDKKYCQYFNAEYVGTQDYIAGGVCDVTDSAVARYNKEGYRKYKGMDLKNDVKQVRHTIKGAWTQEVKEMDQNQPFISIYKDFPLKLQHAQYPLASDANFRMDVLSWKLRKFDDSQQWKERLEITQRGDRKLREAVKKKKH